MRRLFFVAAALALVFVIVFAPRPWRGHESAGRQDAKGSMGARALAPTIDPADIRHKSSTKPVRKLISGLGLACLLAAIIFASGPGALLSTRVLARRLPLAPVDLQWCRAPPHSLA